MTVDQIAGIVSGRIVCGSDHGDRGIDFAFAADLMSDVLTLTHDNLLFITGLVTAQTIRTAVVADIRVVLIVRGKSVPQSIIDLARDNDVVLIATDHSMYRASGELYAAGLQPIY